MQKFYSLFDYIYRIWCVSFKHPPIFQYRWGKAHKFL